MDNLQRTSQWDSTPQPIRCDRDELILALTIASEPWKKLDIIDATLRKCGLDPFFEVLDIPNHGILGKDISESDRRGHENYLIRALVIQAFGKIPDLVKKSAIAALSNDVSQNLLTVLKHEAIHGETPLIRLSALSVIRSIWYDEEWKKQGKNYSIPVGINAPRLYQKMIEEQVEPLNSNNRPILRVNYTGSVFSTQYQDYLDFWMYGPIWELFSLPLRSENYKLRSEDYKSLVQDVLKPLFLRGVKNGLNSENNYIVIEESLQLLPIIVADQINLSPIFTEISNFLQYSEEKFRNRLIHILTPYKQKLDDKSLSILEALLFNFSLEELELNSLSILEIKCEIVNINKYRKEINGIFSSALSACNTHEYEVTNQEKKSGKKHIFIQSKESRKNSR